MTDQLTKNNTYTPIHPATRIGSVNLTVSDLDRQVEFYKSVIGLQLHWREANAAGLGAGRQDLLILTRKAGARRYANVTGLYHFAILLPNLRELARVIARLVKLGYRNFPTDHVMTKTTYLDDPEGQNIELYADTPEEGSFMLRDGVLIARRVSGEISDGREPLDLQRLFDELSPDDSLNKPMPPETTIGHIHLYVADLEKTMHFYHTILGFDDMGLAHKIRMGMVSAGGYHHHIGFNTWVGEGALPPPPDALGLRYFSVILPHQAELEAIIERVQHYGIYFEQLEDGILIRDPSQNALLLTTPSYN
jgi:catechol 2,3-dioxygenase